MFATRYLFYLFVLALYFFYSVLRFITKPGSRLLVPLALAAFAFLGSAAWQGVITSLCQLFDPGLEIDSDVLDILLGIAWLIVSLAYVIASRMLALIFGAFPVALRPMPPTPTLKAPMTKIEPAIARIIVPPLPKR